MLPSIHQRVCLVACLFLIMLSISGFLLALKAQVSWVRPETKSGGEVALSDMVSMQQVADAAFSAGFAELK